eukprot:gnl/TRDRNA2_/TRDRNA2_175258_c1_seq1.p1 gnl/TRDRNA2_/TRDRNA2_175258_c1~~gnl/TRDRNA2_/TRDRNA2_175258_c1_seq1.p1  ORF type:complete len:167 (+),score=9.61 gnl/TRDRNA2_/TRDRNA2_175258_c1_seq1:82-582(+)
MGQAPIRNPEYFNNPPRANQVDILSEGEAGCCKQCCGGYTFAEDKMPSQLSDHLSEDEFKKATRLVNERAQKDAQKTSICAILILLTAGVSLFLGGFCWFHFQRPWRKKYNEETAFAGWKAKGLGVDFLPGEDGKPEDKNGPAVEPHPARIRVTLPGTVIGKPQGP